MSEISELINVTFEDQTSYIPESGEDVIGVPIEHCWGPVDQLQVLNLPMFVDRYPEAYPIGAPINSSIAYMHPWAQARRALKAGAASVEVIRAKGAWQYKQFNIGYTAPVGAGEPTFPFITASSATQFATDTATFISIALKYPGVPPKSGVFASASNIKVNRIIGKVGSTEPPITIQLFALNSVGGDYLLSDTVDEIALIETHYGSFDETDMVDGQSFFIEKVLERDSLYLACQINKPFPVLPTTASSAELPLGSFAFPTPLTATEFGSIILNKYSDPELSVSTIILAPLNGDNTLNSTISGVAKEKKTMIFPLGYPLANNFTYSLIDTYQTSTVITSAYNLFTYFLAGREKFTVLGKTMILDCTAAWAGLTAQLATSFRINQLPSAKTYGGFDGVLVAALSFNEVLQLHGKGVNSVYMSNSGPRIFGIRSRHNRPQSYFAKANISRVITRILKVTFPVVMEAIHTETVSDASERATFNTKVNRIIDQFISQGDINPGSYADVSDAINSDAQTNGGEVLNINLVIYFKKLTEKANIKIIATDSSVTATIN